MMAPSVSLTARIRDEAYRLGFFKVGVTRAGPLPQAENFDRWLREEMHGEMAYMEHQAAKRRATTRAMRTLRIPCAEGSAVTPGGTTITF